MYEVFNKFTQMIICNCPDDYKAEQVCKALNEMYGTDNFEYREV